MESTKPSANCQPYIDQYTPRNSSMLVSVLSLVRPSRTNLPFARTSRATVLNFQSSTPTGPSLAARFAHTFLSESCRSIFSMRAFTVRYSLESGGSSTSARSHASFAPSQSLDWPASLACCDNASNSCACASRPQEVQLKASGARADPQFEHGVDVAESTTSIVSG